MMNFNKLVKSIEQTHGYLQAKVAGAVNMGLTIRNWLFGLYIVEFELHGKDRAKYGESLMDELSKKLQHIKGIDRRSLFRFRQFYNTYPYLNSADSIKSILDEMNDSDMINEKVGTLPPQLNDEKVGTVFPQSESEMIYQVMLLKNKLI
jgi:hypothetical protein